ncbi:MAG: glycosyltransferase family 4 protein [Akkermansiaceae bacterium]|nr:glycosyltransferase family 4 protein [Akkermansiaceae bacterium]
MSSVPQIDGATLRHVESHTGRRQRPTAGVTRTMATPPPELEPLRGKRIVYLTAGAAGMFCGSCLRDNAAAAGLRSLGLDLEVPLVPLYTPIRTDEADLSVDQVFFGGINVYLQQKIPLFRHLPAFLDHWLDRPGLLRRVSSHAVSIDPKALGELTLSMIRGEHGNQRKEMRRLVHWMQTESVPDAVCLTNLLVGGCIPGIRRELGVPVVVTLQGDDVFLDALAEPWRSRVIEEMRLLATQVDGFFVFNDDYAARMANLLDLPPEKLWRIPLGIDTTDYLPLAEARFAGAPASAQDPVTIGYFARLCREKGFDLLVDAWIRLCGQRRTSHPGTPLPRLRAGGWLPQTPASYLPDQAEKIRLAGLSEHFEYVGAPEREGKLDFLRATDLFCVPAHFCEPKGLYALEAMASGLPVVGPDHGAFPPMIHQSGGGRLHEANNAADLARVLGGLLDSPAERLHLGRAGQEWVARSATRQIMAEGTARKLAVLFT